MLLTVLALAMTASALPVAAENVDNTLTPRQAVGCEEPLERVCCTTTPQDSVFLSDINGSCGQDKAFLYCEPVSFFVCLFVFFTSASHCMGGVGN
jgi:hypothetical protein